MENLCKNIVKKLKESNNTISFMESCTGGYLANLITNISGSSEVLKVSLVTYSNEYKIKFGVSKEIIDKYTVYSEETAKEMAKNVAIFANSSFGVGVTGELGNRIKEHNKVYYSIYSCKTNSFDSEMICVEPKENRELMKQQIAEKIMSRLLEII